MIDLIILYRALNLFSHHAHNMVKGDEFFQDHAFFAEVYDLADKFYDDTIEREIGTKSDKISLIAIMHESSKLLMPLGNDYYQEILKLIEKTMKEIDSLTKNGKLSIGTQNMIAGQADELEKLVFKINRRVLDEMV